MIEAFGGFLLKKSFIQKLHYNHGHNVFRIFDILGNFPFTTSETKRSY